MQSLVADVRPQLLEICLERPIEALCAEFQGAARAQTALNESVVNRNRLVVPLTTAAGWKVLVVVNVRSLETLRHAVLHTDLPAQKEDKFASGSTQLMVRSLEMVSGAPAEPVVRVESDDDDARVPEEGESFDRHDDTKKGALTVEYKARRIVSRGVDLMVLSRPRS